MEINLKIQHSSCITAFWIFSEAEMVQLMKPHTKKFLRNASYALHIRPNPALPGFVETVGRKELQRMFMVPPKWSSVQAQFGLLSQKCRFYPWAATEVLTLLQPILMDQETPGGSPPGRAPAAPWEPLQQHRTSSAQSYYNAHGNYLKRPV